jgi:hypothetical protein
MAMSGSTLRDLIDSKMAASNSEYAASPERANIKASLGAIAEAIVEHITAQAVVAVTSVSGVTAGGAVSGPGTGSIS